MRLLHVALLVLAAPLVALADEPAPKAPELAVESYRLPNGLKVALHRDPTVPRVTVCVAYHVGSKNERAGRTGFAHFFEHMMFRGTKNVPNYDIPLQEAGAQSNAFTSEDMTVYFETVPSNYLERALYLEAERLAFLPSALDQEKFDTEREVVKNERRQSYENRPYGLAEETILANLFPEGHPYSWSVIGSMKDLDAASLDDLKRFFAEFYHPGNATLCLAGDFDPAEARRLIETYFGPLARGPELHPVEAPDAPPAAKRVEQTDQVQLPRVYWSWPTVADDHPDAPALDLLAYVLSGGEASRLRRRLVREARVSTDVAASSDAKEIAGLFQIQSTAAEGKTLAEIQAILADELEHIRHEPPTAQELERALAMVESGFYRSLTSPLMRAVVLASGFAQKDDPNYYKRDFDRYFRVTPDDLRRVAERYLTPETLVLEIVPAAPGQEETTAVEAGPKPGDRAEEQAIPERTPEGGPDWSAMPGPGEPRPFHAPEVVRKRLSNGLEVWIAPWHTLPIVSARLLVPGGTADDPPGKSGLATLHAALADKGTDSLSATELAEAFDVLGAAPEVSALADESTIGLDVLARNLEPTMTLLGAMLATPRLDPEDVERERQLQLAALLQGPDDPRWIAWRASKVLLHGKDHPYGNPAQGYVETVKGLSREDVHDFHRTYVVPDGSTLIVVGDVNPDALIASLEKALGGWTGEAPEASPRPAETAPIEPGVIYLADKPGAVQSVLSVGRRWVERTDPRYFAALLGNRILGGDFLSRLNQNLREEHGFTYGAQSSFGFRRDRGVWSVATSVRADATAPALKEVIGELDALSGGKPFTEEEIRVARSAESRGYPDQFETPSGIVGILAEMARFNLPSDYLDTFLDRLQAPDLPSINRVMAEAVSPADRVVLVVGDREQVEPELKALGFREVRLVTPDGVPVSD